MRDRVVLGIQLLVSLVKLPRPGSVRTVIAESLLLKLHLLIKAYCRRRSLSLTTTGPACHWIDQPIARYSVAFLEHSPSGVQVA